MNVARTLLLGGVAMAILATSAGAAVSTVTVPMKALNNSGETGSAVVTQVTDGVQVVVSLKGAPKDPQPTHIHIGTCGHINLSPEFPLINTVGGKSTTVVKGVTLAQLLAGHYAINVHKSSEDLATYVACGDIK